MSFRFLKKERIKSLPQTTGIYCFTSPKAGSLINNKEILYIGKAINIKERVKNHYNQANFKDSFFIEKTEKIGWIETNSEIEALILEAELIKKYKPKYNTIWKDDKNYSYVTITKEKLPRVFIAHQPDAKHNTIGPFVDAGALKKTLTLLRRVFPYYVSQKHPKNNCSWCYLGLCPGPNPDPKEYKKNLKRLVLVLQSKRSSVLTRLKKEMKKTSDTQEFERASKIRNQIASLERIMANARIFEKKEDIEIHWKDTEKTLRNILKAKKTISRIEAYDISNIQGKMATGSMVVFIGGKPVRNLYRKFKIKINNKPNDIAMLKEALTRRMNHEEWSFPELILIDGGKAQLNAGISVRSQFPIAKTVKIMSLAKRNNELFIEGRKQPLLLKNLSRSIFNLILQLRDEAHRFAIAYHKKLRKLAR